MHLWSAEGHLLAVFMLMAGLSSMLLGILQSQLGCFSSASHYFSSSNKLTPAGLHGSQQNSEREKSVEGLPRTGLSSGTASRPPQFISQSKLRESQG